MGSLTADVLLARAYLNRVAEPGCIPLWTLIERVGPVEAAAAVRSRTAPDDVLAATEQRAATADPEADLGAAERHGLRLVTPESDDWPHFALAALERTGRVRAAAYARGARRIDVTGEPIPPLALWVRGPGDLTTLATRSAGVVGARAATAYGEQVTIEFGFGLAGAGVVVVSGGAYGIDAAAHRAALAAGGVTVAVSAGGADRAYPPGNTGLFEQIAETGLVVSESPPGCAPQRLRFLSRNRLIASFATGVLVIEAALRSGARNTVKHAGVLGRPVFAVPGPITSAMSVGCHELVRDGSARLVTSVAQLLEEVGPMGVLPADPAASALPASDVRTELDTLEPDVRRVFEGLPGARWATPEAIAGRVGVSVLDVIRALPALDLAGLVESSDAGYRLSARWRKPRAVAPSRASPRAIGSPAG